MYQGVIMSGFGGQGIVSAGILLANAGMIEDKYVTFFPAYGAEMRGGTANCSVVVSSEEVSSPVVARPDTVIVMNEPSLHRFESQLKPGGLMLINSSLVAAKPKREDIEIVFVDANTIAEKIGTLKVANMVMLGAYSKKTGAVNVDSLIKSLPKVYKKAKEDMLKKNQEALRKGMEEV
ncbi:MAG: 2-oxoacid:ferredoxin oxidoreductase subunit gamma [candidate division Zixibacteria bacterium SM23_73_2]|nr:MAG: 2-oxoacid:ferredoxin oxidoreductase subunit gamma [candidate division Zixibacteria bacterium SM23_73_2]